MMDRAKSEKGLRQIPGIGSNMEHHLYNIGIHQVGDLVGQDPEDLYRRDCAAQGCPVDRCALYVYRAAVYYADNEVHQPDKLLWWHWKD